MLKYELIPGQLLHEGTIALENLFAPQPCPDEVVLLTHDKEYLQRLKLQQLTDREQRRIGFPQSPELTRRELIIAQGTVDCSLYAIENGISLNVAGGTHHAFRGRGEGFCMLNDQAIAANYLLHKKLVSRILIVDLDVHQGNGTASIFEKEPRVFSFSMHGKNNYPFHKEKSDLDIELPDGIDNDAYLELLGNNLELLMKTVRPDFVFYLAGADVLDTDKFGKLKLTIAGCKQRDRLLFDLLKKRAIPCAISMGGGYSEDVRIITEAHCNTFRLAKQIWDL